MAPWVWPKKGRYTPELMADGQYRFEWTDEPVPSIAADFDILPTSFWRLAQREGWKRRVRPARDVPRAAKIRAQLEAVVEKGAAAAVPSPHQTGRPRIAEPPSSAGEPAAAAPPIDDASAVDRLHQAAMEELAAVEAMRAERRGQRWRRPEAEVTARTLATLTDTLHKLQRMRAGLPVSGTQDHDDTPVDIDAFRLDLASHIEAFVRSELDAQDADAHSGSEPVADVR